MKNTQNTLVIAIIFMSSLLFISCNNNSNKNNSSNSTESPTKQIEWVKIGTQAWTTKNLDVSTYRNGDIIPQVQDATQWLNDTTGAWCYYENETANGTTYGKLYNWYAVNAPRGLAPNGYHIPTKEEWLTLIDYLGGEYEVGKKMKSISGWRENGNGTNSSGFTGLPGGVRSGNGTFDDFGENGSWWSSTEYNAYCAWNWYLTYGNIFIYNAGSDYSSGMYVRCLRD